VLTFKPHKLAVTGIAFSPDGRFLATASRDASVRRWNLDGPTEVEVYPGNSVEATVAFSPDGRFLACHDDLIVWEIETRECALELDDGLSVAFAPDGKEVATIFLDDTVRRWVLPSRQALPAISMPSAKSRRDRSPTGALAYSPDGKNIAIVYEIFHGPVRSHILLLGRNTGKPRLEIVTDFGFGHPSAIAFSPDGIVIAGNYGPILGVVNAKTGEKVAALRPGRKHFTGFCFTPDGKRLIGVNNDAAVHVYDTATWTELTGYEWQIGKLTAVAVAPDGLRAACGSDRGRVVVWDLDV
jgi:WD40 repeat protein